MERAKIDSSEIRDNRLTIYLTDAENESLEQIARLHERTMAQIIVTALKDWMERFEQQDNEAVREYVCGNGHAFWIERVTSTYPRWCPICRTGAKEGIGWKGKRKLSR